MVKQNFKEGNKKGNKKPFKLNGKKRNDDKTKRFPSKAEGKRGRLIIRNLPYNCTEEKLAEVLGEFGKIVEMSLPKHSDSKKPTGFGFVNFTSRLSADKAKEALTGTQLMGRTIYLEKALAKDKFTGADQDITLNNHKNWPQKGKNYKHVGSVDNVSVVIKKENDDDNVKEEVKEKLEEESNLSDTGSLNNSVEINESDTKTSSKTKNQVKQPHEISKKKKARIIIRNLPFKSTEEKLRNHFSTFGDIIDLNLLRRVDNKLVGCAFVEFASRKSAVKAIIGSSGKPFLGRVIVVDWAVPVKDFRKANKANKSEQVTVKEEVLSSDVEESDEELNRKVDIDKKLDLLKVKQEELRESSDEESDHQQDADDDDNEDHDDPESNDDDDDSDDMDDDTIDAEPKPEVQEQKRERFQSHDTSEGRTVFIKNVPFSATKEDLSECVKQFGPIFYALICVDPVSEHSRGTAFVKFRNKEDAENCLSAGTSFTLHGSVLDPHLAIDRDKLKEMKEKRKDSQKDLRNLYLIKEGIIVAGTAAAKDVSMSDMSHRLQLEQYKTQTLKNLNMFVSRNRLIVHNLPPDYDNKKLKQLFLKHTKPSAVVTEARVMRNLKDVDSKGVGISKEYGFVSFNNHEDALQALRNINNNPHIFTADKRPIVAFSVENRRVMNIRSKRLERSKINNPLSKIYRGESEGNKEGKGAGKSNKKFGNWRNRKRVFTEEKNQDYVGVESKPGVTPKLRSKYKLTTQAELHHVNVNQERKQKKKGKGRMQPIKAIKRDKNEKKLPKKKANLEKDSHFSSLVDKYKSQLLKSDNVRKKWYE